MSLSRRFIVLLISGWLIQSTLVPYISVGKAMPDLVLILIATYSFLEGPTPGGFAGFSGGVLQDLLLVRSFGLNILSKTVIGYLAGLVERNLFGSARILPTIAMFAVSISSQLIFVFLSFVIGEGIELKPAILNVIIPSALYTGLITFFIFKPITRILSHERRETVFK